MSNPYDSPKAEIINKPAPDPQPRLGRAFWVSLPLSLGLFVFLPAFPLNYFIATIGTVWGIAGIILACASVRGAGWIAALFLSGFYVFLLYMTWFNLFARMEYLKLKGRTAQCTATTLMLAHLSAAECKHSSNMITDVGPGPVISELTCHGSV